MARRLAPHLQDVLNRAGRLLSQPLVLALLPTISLSAFWIWGEAGLLIAALVAPALILGLHGRRRRHDARGRDLITGLMPRDEFEQLLTNTLDYCLRSDKRSALFKIEVDDHDVLIDRYGQHAVDVILLQLGRRIATSLRSSDTAARVGEFAFVSCLSPVQRLDLDICIQLAGRLQQAIDEPFLVDGVSVYLTSTIGFCQHNRIEGSSADKWLSAANIALRVAQNDAPGAIRAYSDEMRQQSESRAVLRQEVSQALEERQIQAWFQPQVCTDTGRVSGFEALARWHHPQRGLIQPGDFLPSIEQAGLLERLTDIMMTQGFTALKAWDAAGVIVPQVGVNFAGPELRNPKLVDKVMWELDRFELSPDRLAVEVLETVVASSPDDVVARNINGLSNLGCRIDLDDFGTGNASITSIRRFAVGRIKIDRSFVMKCDRDPEQQKMVGAILTMAERMDVETLAEGVETVGEHALLAQLGCNHVQGFGIARPMPFEETIDWLAAHNTKLQDTTRTVGNRLR